MKYWRILSRRNGPISRSFTLPEAPRSVSPKGISSWPAPSATTMTACPRATMRLSNRQGIRGRPQARKGYPVPK